MWAGKNQLPSSLHAYQTIIDLNHFSVFALRRPSLLQQHNITHVLSVIEYSFSRLSDPDQVFSRIEHQSIDIDDLPSEDILVHFPKMVRFIERGLYGEMASDQHEPSGESQRHSISNGGGEEDVDAILPALDSTSTSTSTPIYRPTGPSSPSPTGAVLVHCALGKSRSVSAIMAYLLWKYPERFGRRGDPCPANPSDLSSTNTSSSSSAVMQALKLVRETRPLAGPNGGFLKQLELWWEMGCPAGSDDAVERDGLYQAWLAKRNGNVDDTVGDGEWIVFEE